MSAATIGTRAAGIQAPATEKTALVVPLCPEGTLKAWRRMITHVDAARSDAFAFDGVWLDAGVAYELPVGAVVVACDQYPQQWVVRMLRVDAGGLEETKAWELKARLGKRVTDFVGRRLAPGAAGHRAARLEAMPNLWDGWCAYCRQAVPARSGRVVKADGCNRVMHHPGQCPPRPERIVPNRYAGTCFACGGWVAEEQGVAILRDAPDKETGSRYSAMHNTPCPPDTVPGPPNVATGWCADCGELVAPDQGYYFLHQLHHRGACPRSLGVPTWIIRRKREPLKPGEAARVRVDLRTGMVRVQPRDSLHDRVYRRRGGPPVPPQTPGYRVLSKTYIELIAVAVECVERSRGRQLVRVRAATAAEAADLLAQEVPGAVDARPDAGAHMARWHGEIVGQCRPWLAEITGRCPDYGYRREFQRGDWDDRNANSSQTRGVILWWTLAPNRVYEVMRPVSRSRTERMFLRATAEGDVVEINAEEVESWLNASPVWPAS